MAVGRLHNLFIATHHFDETLAFWRALGYEVTRDIRPGAAMLEKPDAPSLLIDAVPADRAARLDIYFEAPPGEFDPSPAAEVVHPFAPTHWGTEVMELRDPDGRAFHIERR